MSLANHPQDRRCAASLRYSGAPRALAWKKPHSLVNLPITENLLYHVTVHRPIVRPHTGKSMFTLTLSS